MPSKYNLLALNIRYQNPILKSHLTCSIFVRFIRWFASQGVYLQVCHRYSISQTAEIQDLCISTLIILLYYYSQGVQIKIFKKFADHYFVFAAPSIIMKEKKTANVSCNIILTYLPATLLPHASPHHTAYTYKRNSLQFIYQHAVGIILQLHFTTLKKVVDHKRRCNAPTLALALKKHVLKTLLLATLQMR